MQVLLPPEWFQQVIELQPIEKNDNKKENLPSTKTPNPVGQLDPIGQTRSSEEDSTLPEQVMNANQKDGWYTSICAHLKNPTTHAKPEDIKIKGYRMSKGLLMKENQLWMPYNRLFQPLPVPERPWVDVTMDFVTCLPKCHAYD